MSHSHESIFTYTITRPYPFRWFTPVVVTAFILLTTLFSMINYIYNGYDLVSEISHNPNATMHDQWFKKWPDVLSAKAQTSCQTVTIPVNTEIFTNQTALTYTLTSIAGVQSADDNPHRTFPPALTYFNNKIEGCVIWAIQINLESLDRSANQIAYDEWGAEVWTYISCTIQTADGLFRFNLTQEYDFVPPSVTMADVDVAFLGSDFISRDPYTKASLWWGESLLSTYWALLTMQMQQIRQLTNAEGKPAIRKGTLLFYPNRPLHQDITGLDFFRLDYRYIIDTMDPPGTYSVIWPGAYDESYNVSYLESHDKYPDVWVYADSLAKSMYSTVLADLGQVNVTPNILTDPSVLEYYSKPLGHIQLGYDVANALPGPSTAPYLQSNSTTGPLTLTPSTITAEYLCQIPRRKSVGNLIMSILVADLVLLQSSWTVFKLVTGWLFLRGDDAQKCLGCASATK